jgi:hypothetical protein
MKKPSASRPNRLPQSAVLEELEAHAKRLLVEQMKSRKLGYAELSELLAQVGIQETPDRLNRKVNRLKFQASFLLACLVVMEVEKLDLRAVDVTAAGRKERLLKANSLKQARAFRRRRPLAADTD